MEPTYMGVLLISRASPFEDFEVSFLKETIQWYHSGTLYHVIRLFVQPLSQRFSGFKLVLEHPVQSVVDGSGALRSAGLLDKLKEQRCRILDDGSVEFDGYHYMPTSVQLTWENLGRFSVIQVSLARPLTASPVGLLRAFQLIVRAEDRRYSMVKLMLFGAIELDTYLLMPPSTVTVEAVPVRPSKMQIVHFLEGRAKRVKRYELWVKVEGAIEATSIESTHPQKKNRKIDGEGIIEEYYPLPPLKRGWELAIDFRKDCVWFNEAVRCSFSHKKFSLVLTWVFGIATILALILAIVGKP